MFPSLKQLALHIVSIHSQVHANSVSFSGTVQVSATLSGGKSLLDSQSTVNGVDPAIMAGINNSIAGLALPAKEKQVRSSRFYLASVIATKLSRSQL